MYQWRQGNEAPFRLEIDGEGVVRVFAVDGVRALVLTPEQLGQLLTALLKAVLDTGSGGEEAEVDVQLN